MTFDFHSRGTETGILGFLATFTLVPLRMESDRHALPTPTRQFENFDWGISRIERGIIEIKFFSFLFFSLDSIQFGR